MKQLFYGMVIFSLFFSCADDQTSELSSKNQYLIKSFNKISSEYSDMADFPNGGFAVGLANVGNSCYANAAYKFFLSFPQTRAFLIPRVGLDPKVEVFRKALIRLANLLANPTEPEYQEFFEGTGSRKHVNAIIMSYIRDCLWQTGWTQERNKDRQLDSGELLLALADKFQTLDDYSRLKRFEYSHSYEYS